MKSPTVPGTASAATPLNAVPHPPLSLFVYAHLDAAGTGLLRSALGFHRVYFADKHATDAARQEQLRHFRECDICFGNIPAEWLANAPRLRWLQLESIGFEYYRHLRNLPPALTITNLKGLFDRPAAETALAGLLALYRGVDALVPAQAERRWVCLDLRPRMQLLHGKRVVILGHGSIGRKLRQLLEAFSCRVQSFARSARDAELRTTLELDRALPQADIVACCLPYTADTRGFIDRARLALLGPGAVFVNIGRGAVVDEPALVEALNARRIGGAVLDVTIEEPLPAGHPLWACPNTLLLQHTGGGYKDELLDKARSFLANLAAFQSGQPLRNVVDLVRGY
jgi:phosphoglycerate dehydrogenase-like enzyme